jgi:hypothetical protein
MKDEVRHSLAAQLIGHGPNALLSFIELLSIYLLLIHCLSVFAIPDR